MIPQIKQPTFLLQQQIDDLLEKSSENIKKAKRNQDLLQKDTEDYLLSKRETVITENDPLNFALGIVSGFSATYETLSAFKRAKNLWNSRNVKHLNCEEKPLNSKETGPLLMEREAAISRALLNNLPKEIPGRDTMYSEIKKILMNIRSEMELDGSGKKDKLYLKQFFACLERTIRDPQKAEKEYGDTLFKGCLKAIEKLKTLLTDIDPNINADIAIKSVLSNAWRGLNSADCVKTAAAEAIQFLKNEQIQSHNIFLNQTDLELVRTMEQIGSNHADNNPNPYSPNHPQDSNLWNKVKNGSPSPNTNIKTVYKENFQTHDLPNEKFLNGAKELAIASLRAYAAARSGNWAAAALHSVECAKSTANGVLNISEFFAAGSKMMDDKGLKHLNLMDPLSPISPSHTTDCNAGPGVTDWMGKKIGAALQGYGDVLNQVDVYGEPFNPYSDSTIPSSEDPVQDCNYSDRVSSFGGPFDRGSDPTSGWPEK